MSCVFLWGLVGGWRIDKGRWRSAGGVAAAAAARPNWSLSSFPTSPLWVGVGSEGAAGGDGDACLCGCTTRATQGKALGSVGPYTSTTELGAACSAGWPPGPK
mgnify:CR=1 FL=1